MDNNLILKRFFSKTVLRDLLSGKRNEVFDCVVKRYITNPEGKTYEELISEIYVYMGKTYRTEYYYKNTMLNRLLLKKHNYRKTVVLTELPIGGSKADFIMINGEGIVYEIKTELDNLERLSSQVEDYYKAFTKVVIVTYEENIDKVLSIVPKRAGIMQLTKRKALKSVREPVDNRENLDYYTIFKILRKYEFENILWQEGFELPKVNQFLYYKECFRILQKINIESLQKKMLNELKKRMRIETVEFCVKAPEELRFLTYFDNTLVGFQTDFFATLNKNYGG